MAKYGFGEPYKLGENDDFKSDNDLASAVSDDGIFLVYKRSGKNHLFATRYKSGSWVAPVDTGAMTKAAPAITRFKGDLYVFWLADGGEIDYGIMDPKTLKVTLLGAVPKARTKVGVGAATYKENIYVLHIGETLGIGGRNIYQVTFDGKQWSKDEKIESAQASKDAPALAPFERRLFQFHRGQTDGPEGNTVYYSFNDRGASNQWSKNEQVGTQSSQQRPGAGTFAGEVVVVHIGDERHDLRLAFSPQAPAFIGGEEIEAGAYVSSYAPAVPEYEGAVFLVFADRNDSDRLKVGRSTNLRKADSRIALYIGNEMYPSSDNDVGSTIRALQESPLTSPILSLVNRSSANPELLVYNDVKNPIFDNTGKYLGASSWADDIRSLRSGGSVREVYLSFSTNGTAYLADLLSRNSSAALQILRTIRETLGFDGIDLDDESGKYSPGDPIYVVATAAIKAKLKVTAAPYRDEPAWRSWVKAIQNQGGTIAWLNLQCYAGGKSNNPGTWLDIGVPIVPGSCANCGEPLTKCSPADMQALFTLWRTGKGSVSRDCWDGTPNTSPQAIGGGFIWVYSSIAGPSFLDYMNAVKNGLGM